MTRMLDRALEAARRRPPAEQDAIADAILSMVGEAGSDEFDPEEVEEALRGLAQVDRGEFATQDEIEAAFSRFRG